MIDNSVRPSTILGTLIITFITAILIANTVLFVLGLPLSSLSVPVAGIITFGIGWWLCINSFNQNHQRIFFSISLTLLLIIITATVVNSIVYDISFDGQTYHSEAIISLANGWNPFKTQVPTDIYYQDWVGFFSKGPWIIAAAMYRFTGNIETGKVFNSLLLIASGLFSFSAFATFPHLNRRWRINLSLMMMLNPVSICQLFTFYVDGQLASCLIILIAILIMLRDTYKKIYLLVLAATLVIITNIKLTGILYTAIIIGGFIGWYVWQFRRQAVSLMIYCISALAIGVLIVGYNPIVSQFTLKTIEKGDPFYPVSWSQLIAIDRNMPQNFLGKDRFLKFGLSLFSKAQVGTESTQLKIPFTLSIEEWFSFRYPDVRTSGFGPLFSGVILLSILILIIGLTQYGKQIYTGFIPLLILLVISIISTSEAWWARYVPQLWILPILITALSIKDSSKRLFQYLIGIWAFVLMLNIVLVASLSVIAMIKDQQALQVEFNKVKQIENKYGAISLTQNAFPITQVRFAQNHISFKLVDKPLCSSEQQHPFIYSWSVICDPDMQMNTE